MDILENPFWTLGTTSRDKRRRIMELAEEKSLLLDEDAISSARSILTNPRKRFTAEIAWLPGLGPSRAFGAVSHIQKKPYEILHQDNIPALARANLLAAGLKCIADRADKDDQSEWIIELAAAFDEIDQEAVLGLINEDREVSGFPTVTDLNALEAEIDSRRQHYRSVIRDALNHLSPSNLVEVITEIVETATDFGAIPAPLLIDDLVDTYEVEAQDFLEKEEGNIDDILQRIRSSADDSASDATLGPDVDKLISIVRNWDVVAQPIQVSTKSRGLGHGASTRVAHKVRDVAILLFNKHDKLDLSQKIATMLQEVFAEVVDVVDRNEEDVITLDKIAEQRKLSSLLDPISNLCTKALESIEIRPSGAFSEAQKVNLAVSRLLNDLRNANAPENLINQGKDEIALTLTQCAVVYGNETNKWKECVSVLEDAMKTAAGQEARKRIRKNLLTANQNKARYGDLTQISSAPNLWTINGFGFTLYGSTDLDALSGSYIQ